MQCKKCGVSFSGTTSHEIWEFKRHQVQADQGSELSRAYVSDAGVFCSRECLKGYLDGGTKSGIFSLKKPLA